MGWIEGLTLPSGINWSGAVSQSSSLPTKLWGGQVTLPAGTFYSVSQNSSSLPNNIPAHIQTNSSTSGSNNTMTTQSSTNTTASASSSSPVAPIQNLMNNWYAWGVQPTNAAGNEPTNTKAALNTMTNQWQFFPSQNTASANTTSTATTTLTASANASPQASNGLSEVAQEFEKAIDSIFGSISNFVKNL